MAQNAYEFQKKMLLRLAIATQGLEQCCKVLAALSETLENTVIHEAALSFAVVLYAQPFLNNSQGGCLFTAPRVKDKKLLKTLYDKERDLHERLIAIRKKALAHAEWEKHPYDMSAFGVLHGHTFSIYSELQPDARRLFGTLANKVHSFLANEKANSFIRIQNLTP